MVMNLRGAVLSTAPAEPNDRASLASSVPGPADLSGVPAPTAGSRRAPTGIDNLDSTAPVSATCRTCEQSDCE